MDQKFYHVFFVLIVVMLLSRANEILYSMRNEKKLLNINSVKLLNPYEHYVIYLFHFFWFICLFIEAVLKKEIASGYSLIICYAMLALAQILRIESMNALGISWTTKIYNIPSQYITRRGIYEYFAHPSYLAVLLEFIALPYLFHAYWTLIVFFPMKFILIANRIRLEKQITGRYL